MLITPFMVKNAASSREKSSTLTSECSYNSSTAATSTPTKYSAPAPAPRPAIASAATVVMCSARAMPSAFASPNVDGTE